MLEGSIVDFAHKGAFHLSEANEIVLILNRVTKKHGEKVNSLISMLENLPETEISKSNQLEAQISKEIELWNNKVRKLGATPKGMWLADIDSGDGYFCWKYPETEIKFWHDYKGGYSSRISLGELKDFSSNLKNYGDARNSDIY